MDVMGVVNHSLSPCLPAHSLTPFSLKFLSHFHLSVQGVLYDFPLTTFTTIALFLGFGILLSKRGNASCVTLQQNT